ncbi:hypothetical protein HKD37_19G052648 [Glycine soja]
MTLFQSNVYYDHEVLYSRSVSGSISKGENAKKKNLEEIEQYFAKRPRQVTFWTSPRSIKAKVI